MMKRAIQVMALSAMMLFGMGAAAAQATPDTYDTYARMFTRSAGQYWSGNQVGGQWAWSPQNSNESWISWGDPATWPPAYHERFIHSGDWVMLDGWWDNGTYYTVTTTTEWQANSDCATGKVFLPAGQQHYTHWTIPASAYCLYAEGTITEQSSGNSFSFQHKQIWSLQASCANAYNSPLPCLKQHEDWWDNRTSAMTLRLSRDGYLGKGYGPAWNIRQTYPSVWSADGRYGWNW